jgi:hypothetical protein
LRLNFESTKSGTFQFTFDQDTSLTPTKGYDDVTGVGTVNVATLATFASAANN